MILGAAVGVGVDPEALREQLSLLNVDGFSIDFETVDKSGLSATFARVHTAHEHKHRHLSDIEKIISHSKLSVSVKERALAVFTRLAEAEAHVHNEPIEQVHFHEVGALDAIVDVVGAAICFELLKIERFVCSPLHVGSGTVDMAHGRFPVPPPAVAELLKGVPYYSTDIKGELLTPTGAAIITTVCSDYGPMPLMKAEQTGYGAGAREYEKFPNALRIIIGETETPRGSEEQLLMIETNIDDMSPQLFGYVLDRAFELGALDCYVTPVQMKKNRPANLLSILCRPADREKFLKLLFAETTTIGARSYEVMRRALRRETISVDTKFGPIDVKVAYSSNGTINASPEFEQCRIAAKEAGVPLREVQEAARAAYSLQYRSR